MGSQEARALSERILAEGARTGDLTSAFTAHLAPDVTFHLPNGEVGGAAFYAAFIRESYDAFPDITLTLDSANVDDDRVLSSSRSTALIRASIEGSSRRASTSRFRSAGSSRSRTAWSSKPGTTRARTTTWSLPT